MELYGATSGTIELPESSADNFEGEFRSGIRVQCYGIFDSYLSIATVCTKLARYLANQIPGMAIHGYTGPSFVSPDLLAHQYIDRSAPVGIFLGIPSSVPGFFFSTKSA